MSNEIGVTIKYNKIRNIIFKIKKPVQKIEMVSVIIKISNPVRKGQRGASLAWLIKRVVKRKTNGKLINKLSRLSIGTSKIMDVLNENGQNKVILKNMAIKKNSVYFAICFKYMIKWNF